MSKDKINLFDVIPSLSEHITTEKKEGLSVIAFPRFNNKLMQRYLNPKDKSPFLHVNLDEHGSAVWNLIDGERTVGEIVTLLAEHFNHEENYEYRVTMFLTQLQEKGLIKLMGR